MPGRRLPKARAGMVRAGMVRAGMAWTAAVIAVVVMASGGVAVAHDGYRVRPGDTLSAVATRMGVDPGRLAAANGLADPNKIVVGQILKAPSVATTPSAGSTASSGMYKVRLGDTLSQVAPRLGVSEAQLAAANSLSNPNNIIAGRNLLIPTAAATAPTPSRAAASTTPSPAAASTTSVTVGPSWQCPVPGSHFANDYGYVKPGGARHQGVDLYAPRFAPVIAPVAGVVTPYPNDLGGVAFHLAGVDGNRYYGAHMQAYSHTGQVKAGTVIGWVGDSGDAIGGPTHLHFEIHPGGGAATSPYAALADSCP